jgi:hypothetical protein
MSKIMNRIKFSTAVILFVACTAALAQANIFESADPSPLKFESVTAWGESNFHGKVKIEGRFLAIREMPGEHGKPYIRLLFKPNKLSQRILPYDKSRGLVTEIWLRNTESLSLLASKSQIQELNAGKIKTLSGVAGIVITSYTTGVDCDQRGYNALLSSVSKGSTQVVASNKIIQSNGC